MSDYKHMMGYSKKKKVLKEEPKEPTILEDIQDEFGFTTEKVLNEVGAAADYRKHILQIEKSYKKYWDDVKDFEGLLVKKGLKPTAKQIHKQYAKNVLGFQSWFRGILQRLL